MFITLSSTFYYRHCPKLVILSRNLFGAPEVLHVAVCQLLFMHITIDEATSECQRFQQRKENSVLSVNKNSTWNYMTESSIVARIDRHASNSRFGWYITTVYVGFVFTSPATPCLYPYDFTRNRHSIHYVRFPCGFCIPTDLAQDFVVDPVPTHCDDHGPLGSPRPLEPRGSLGHCGRFGCCRGVMGSE